MQHHWDLPLAARSERRDHVVLGDTGEFTWDVHRYVPKPPKIERGERRHQRSQLVVTKRRELDRRHSVGHKHAERVSEMTIGERTCRKADVPHI
jgi:hypothetical protein